MDSASEREWVDQARWDPEAFRQLYRCYLPKVHAYVAQRVPTRQDAEDIIAETFLRVAQNLRRFAWRHEMSFSAWLFRVARNLVTDFYRHACTADSLENAEHLPQPEDARSEPERLALRNEELAYGRELIRRLSPRQQEVLTLRFFGGLRNQEIAVVLGIDERTVATHLCRGLDELHRQRRLDLARTGEGGAV